MKRLLLCCFPLLILAYGAFAQERQDMLYVPGVGGQASLTQYTQNQWTTEDGLPANTMRSMAKAGDGFLWLGTYSGLARFDGSDFLVFSPRNSDLLHSTSMRWMATAPDGEVWVACDKSGVLGAKGNTIRQIVAPETVKARVLSFAFQQDKTWIGTRGNGIFIYENGKVHKLEHERLQKAKVQALDFSPDQELWVGTNKGLFVFSESGELLREFPEVKDVLSVAITESHVFVGTSYALFYKEKSASTFQPYFQKLRRAFTNLQALPNGNLLVASSAGLYRIFKGEEYKSYEIISESNGLQADNLQVALQDEQGVIWCASYRSGLVQLRQGKFTNFTQRTGLPQKTINSICAFDKDAFILTTDNADIMKLQNGKMEQLPLNRGLENPYVKQVFTDSKGNLWVCTYSGIIKYDGVNKKHYRIKDGLADEQIRCGAELQDGRLVFGTKREGLLILNPDTEKFTQISTNTAQKIDTEYIMTLSIGEDGSLLAATYDAGLVVFSPDLKEIKHLNTSNGLPANFVFSGFKTKEGEYWVATNAGIARFLTSGSVQVFTEKHGLPSASVFDLQRDKNNRLWVSCSQGVFYFELPGVNEEVEKLNCQLLNKEDGMEEAECTSVVKMFLDKNDFLWIPTLGGAAAINTKRHKKSLTPPVVSINSTLLEGQTLQPNADGQVILPPSPGRVQINFTTPVYVNSSGIRYYYKLSPLEKEWSYLPRGQSLTYTNLPHGKLTLEVFAENIEGKKSSTPLKLQLVVLPEIYERVWFWPTLITLLLIFFYGIYTWRVRIIKKQKLQLETIVAERTAELAEERDRVNYQREKLQRAYEKIEKVSEIGQAVVGSLEIEAVVKTVYTGLKTLMEAEFFAVAIYRPQMNSFEYFFISDEDEVRRVFKEKEAGNADATTFTNSEAIVVFNGETSESTPRPLNLHNWRGQAASSAMFVPLTLGSKPLGVLTVQSPEKEIYKLRHFNTFQALASYVSVALDNAKAYRLVRESNLEIKASIRYAETIQQAVLPSDEDLSKHFQEHFILFRPKDIVSGDFYWLNETPEGLHLAVVDCTGHGVPGAFMALIAMTYLNEIVNNNKLYSPASILEALNAKIRKALRQDEGRNTDGMDVGLMYLEKESMAEKTALRFAGAKRPAYLQRNNASELETLSGTRRAIGGMLRKKAKPFSEEEVKVGAGDVLYLFSDGYIDQNGPEKSKIGTLYFKNILSTSGKSLSEKYFALVSELDEAMADYPQRDDITVVGIKISE